MMPNADFRRELPRRRNSGSPTSENSENANFLELRKGEVRRILFPRRSCMRARRDVHPKMATPQSLNFVHGKFCELRLYGVLRSSLSARNTQVVDRHACYSNGLAW